MAIESECIDSQEQLNMVLAPILHQTCGLNLKYIYEFTCLFVWSNTHPASHMQQHVLSLIWVRQDIIKLTQ